MKSEPATKQNLQDSTKLLRQEVRTGIDEILSLLKVFMNQTSEKFAEHDAEFRKLNKSYDHLVGTMDGFIARIDRYETELAARDHKIDRLERWIQEIAKSTNVKLST